MLPSIISHNVRKELSKSCKTKNEGQGVQTAVAIGKMLSRKVDKNAGEDFR
jgi:hypothetical protein